MCLCGKYTTAFGMTRVWQLAKNQVIRKVEVDEVTIVIGICSLKRRLKINPKMVFGINLPENFQKSSNEQILKRKSLTTSKYSVPIPKYPLISSIVK
jgi:hypothetical protein